MKLNFTTILLVAIAGFIGYKYVWPMLSATNNAEGGALNAKVGGKTNTNQQDVFGSILSAVNGIFTAVGAVAQSNQKTN